MVLSSPDLDLQGLCWLPDRRIIYSRRESGGLNDANLWQIGINDHTGMPTGPPKRVTRWAGSNIRHLVASTDGKRLIFLRSALQTQMYVGELSEGGTRMKAPRRLTNNEASDEPYGWTPDSKAVLFRSDRNGTWSIFKQQINADEAQAVITGPQDANDPRVSADGEWILYQETPQGANSSTSERLMRVPIAGGVPQFVLEMRRHGFVQCARAPAGVCVIIEETQDQKHWTPTAFDPLKGRGKVLRTMQKDPADNFADQLSPDGSTFAIASDERLGLHIRLLSLSGSTDREITAKSSPTITSLDWSADGKGMYCGFASAQGSTLRYVDLAGNTRVLWESQNKTTNLTWGIPSPDGRYLAIASGVLNSNVWMLEGF